MAHRLIATSAFLSKRRSMSTGIPLPSALDPRQTSTQRFPVYESIYKQLTTVLAPVHYLEIINESHKHNVPANSETHFKVIVVSGQFNEVSSLVGRHRLIHSALTEELKGPVHAMSIVAKSPQQWQTIIDQGNTSTFGKEPSPPCRGGDGSLPKR